MIGAAFLADEPAIFGKPNRDYVDREIDWYYTESLLVEDIPGDTPKIWQQIASPTTGEVNSNYGYLIFNADNHSQYENVLETLATSPHGRRGTMIYTRPTMHDDWNRDGMQDFVCTNAVNYFIRDGAVHAVVQMRSNDVVFGYRNDFAWQRHVQRALVSDLKHRGVNVIAGDIWWQVGSLHIYERHFHLIEESLL